MKFSQFAGTAIVPTLSRLVLAFAFITAGYNKLMDDREYSADDAAILESLGVDVVKTNPAEAEPIAAAHARRIILAGFQATPETPEESQAAAAQDPPAAEKVEAAAKKALENAAEQAAEKASDGGAPGGGPVVSPQDITPPVETSAPVDNASYRAKGMHGVTLLCHRNGWPAPKYMALAAGITELLGGTLLLVGFLSRIWALGLAITMGVAFFFVSMGANKIFATNPFEFALDIRAYTTALAQLGLFVLSFGVLMTGPGPLSLDRMLFGRRPSRRSGALELDDVDDSPSRTSRPV